MLNEAAGRYFGWIIAYVLPGFAMLVGVAPVMPAIGRWLFPPGETTGTVGPPVYTLLAAVTIGMIFSCVRWLTVDQLHQLTGVRPPTWNDQQLDQVLEGFDYLVQNHYRYYEFSSNMLLALLIGYGTNRLNQTFSFLGIGTDLGMLMLLSVLFAASRDALAKYYHRTSRLVGQLAENGLDNMYNGNDHGATGAKPAPSRPTTGSQERPSAVAKPHPTQVKQEPSQK